MNIAPKYDPSVVEEKWYSFWLEKKLFHSEPDHRKSYTVVIPPPNVTACAVTATADAGTATIQESVKIIFTVRTGWITLCADTTVMESDCSTGSVLTGTDTGASVCSSGVYDTIVYGNIAAGGILSQTGTDTGTAINSVGVNYTAVDDNITARTVIA